MREIKLVNNEGEEFDLTRPDACLQDISGIGMEIEFETVRIGQCDVVVDEQPQYNPVSGMIPFMDMEPYTEFLQFIAKRPITLAYKPKNAWYFTSVRVSVVEKEEITPVDEYAETDVDFYRLGPWYSTLRAEPYGGDTQRPKRYDYMYPYCYVDSTAPGILIGNPGKQQSPCTIEIFGPAVNPKWALMQKGTEIASGAVTTEIKEGQKLVVRSEADRLEIAIYTTENEWVEDAYQQSDFSTARFIYAPPGESTLKFSHEGSQEMNVSVEVRAYYEAV